MTDCYLLACGHAAEFLVDHEQNGEIALCDRHAEIVVLEAEMGEVVRCV